MPGAPSPVGEGWEGGTTTYETVVLFMITDTHIIYFKLSFSGKNDFGFLFQTQLKATKATGQSIQICFYILELSPASSQLS